MAAMGATKAYLVLYNLASSLGWAVVLGQLCAYAVRSGGLTGAHASGAGDAVAMLQALSFLEVVHASAGLVRSGAATAFMQWLGRSHVVLVVVQLCSRHDPSIKEHWAVGVMYLAWALSEVIRYPHYVCGLLGLTLPALEWLRYTAFIVLYPVGVFGEVAAIVLAMPTVKALGLYSVAMPNAWNQAFDYYQFLVGTLALLYPTVFPKLFLHMLKQRKKRVGGKAKRS